MGTYEFALAQKNDDDALKKLLRETAMPGLISLAFLREPSYFAALAAEGQNPQVIIAREQNSGDIAACGTRTIKSVFINGQPAKAGYLSGLRVALPHRHGTILARGYHYLAELHKDGAAQFYLTTIMAGNDEAVGLLTSKRAGLPSYNAWGGYIAAALPTTQKILNPQLRIKRGSDALLNGIIAFMRAEGGKKQFFPAYEAEDFRLGRIPGFKIEDFHAAMSQDGSIIGVAGLWDQRSFRQTQIKSYSPAARLARPVYNLFSPLTGYPKLPPPGSIIDSCYASFIVVKDNNVDIFHELINSVLADAKARKISFVITGLHEDDPLKRALPRWKQMRFNSGLFIVCFGAEKRILSGLGGRTPYLEIGTI